MRPVSKTELIKSLIKEKISDRKTLKNFDLIAKSEGKSFEEFILERGIITPQGLAEIKAKISGIAKVENLESILDPSVALLLPENISRKLLVLPLKKEGNKFICAMSDPWNLEAIEMVRKKLRANIDIVFSTSEAILKAIDSLKEIKDISARSPSEEQTIIRLLDNIVQNAIKVSASDIHIEPHENEVLIRYRVDGVLSDIKKLPKDFAAPIIARVKVLASLKLDEHRLPQDGRFKMQINGRRFSFRVSIMPVMDGEKAEIRILEEERKTFSLQELGFTPDQEERIRRSISLPFGMILATGPTGSGKTTTLYTLLQLLNKREVNIVTAEDPIEYRLQGVNQTQIRPEIGLTFANALRSILRQDPNIIMVGEIRDNETAALAVNAALTGHLVLTTLHTNDAPGALPRLLDMKVEGFLIASTVRLIIAQRLVRRLCSGKIPYKLSPEEYNELCKVLDIPGIEDALRRYGILQSNQNLMDITWYRANPTSECPDGYKGRIAIAEVLEVTEQIRKLIFSGANADEIRKVAREEGMITIQEAGFLAAAKGITSIEEVLRAAKEQ
jgi:type IV pilus assembly protein PilB